MSFAISDGGGNGATFDPQEPDQHQNMLIAEFCCRFLPVFGADEDCLLNTVELSVLLLWLTEVILWTHTVFIKHQRPTGFDHTPTESMTRHPSEVPQLPSSQLEFIPAPEITKTQRFSSIPRLKDDSDLMFNKYLFNLGPRPSPRQPPLTKTSR